MVKVIKELLEVTYRNHHQVIEGNLHKEYINGDITFYVHQNHERIRIAILKYSTQKDIYLGANKYIKLLAEFEKIATIERDFSNKVIYIILKQDEEVHLLINEHKDNYIQKLINENNEMMRKLKIAEDRIVELTFENELFKKKNIRGAGRKEKFTPQEKEKIIERRSNGTKLKDLALEFDCSIGMIHKVLNSVKDI